MSGPASPPGPAGPPGTGRAAELGRNLAAVRARVRSAAEAAGRDPAQLVLVVVTKFFPAADVAALAAAGVRDVGENRDQEAAGKAAELRAGVPDLRWHLVGQLQTNKARSVLRYAHAVHSVDRPRLVTALDRAATEDAARAGVPLDCFVQVDLATALGSPVDPARGGAAAADVPALADAVAGAAGLRLRGLMAVAPREADPARAFAALAALAAAVRADHPGADALSAGMSGDLEEAVAAGATHLRVGGAVLGPRPAAR